MNMPLSPRIYAAGFDLSTVPDNERKRVLQRIEIWNRVRGFTVDIGVKG